MHYDDEQLAAIRSGIDEAMTEAMANDRFVSCAWSDQIVQRGAEQFAVFSTLAYKIFPAQAIEECGKRIEYLPVMIDNKQAFFCTGTEEGEEGLLTLMRVTMRRGQEVTNPKWTTIFLNSGWLHAHELTLSSEEITQRIVEEIQTGENVLSRKPIGWV